jgi:hypothetical protein
MRKIDGISYISAKEYAEMMNLTVGRVSQIKAELPFVKFEEFGIELINFDLLTLSQTEKTLAQAKFQTTTPIHELSYKDLGNYFGKFVMDLVAFKGLADTQITDLQAKITDLIQKLTLLENEKVVLADKGAQMTLEMTALNATLLNEHQTNENLLKDLEQSKVLLKDYQDLKTAHNDNKHALEIKSIENKNLVAENDSLKARMVAMELSAQNEADFKEEFKQFKALVMKKIK